MYRVITWEAAYCFSLTLVGFAVRRGLCRPNPDAANRPQQAHPVARLSLPFRRRGACLRCLRDAQQRHFFYIPYDQRFRAVSAQIIIATLLIGVSAILDAASCIAHAAALRFTIPQLVSEALLDDNLSVLLGMISGSDPAAIFALQFGKQTSSRAAILWTGIFGMWLPMILSVSLMSFAKVFGARIYWRPSLPIDEAYAYAFTVSFPDIPWLLLLFDLRTATTAA
ncbi:MAG: hypothetical protein U0R19_09425 [Bryobacteraceae bacterium]